MIFLAIVGGLVIAWLLLVVLFRPRIDYHVRTPLAADSHEFLYTVQSLSETALHHGNRVSILTNGEMFYPAMLEAIRTARSSVNLECYIFHPGDMVGAFIEALAARARDGVIVTLVLDAVGSHGLRGEPLRRLEEAGCRVGWYRTIRWHSLPDVNNRTHRELLIVDGRVGFIGGAGVADWWARPVDRKSPWRDTAARVEGPAVASLQAVFAQNWLECEGEILVGAEFFPTLEPAADATAFVVESSPSDRATASRVVFQLMIESATSSVRINTPYFLPDAALRRALRQTVSRGVSLEVIVPGPLTDQRLVRLASRRWYGELLEGGVRIFEYEPAMMHAKILIVDGLWAIVGTTNLDNRSFEHNDEVNLALRDDSVARRLLEDFERDRKQSREITLETWRRRSWLERAAGPFAWILERQQ
jgi:cardiolipin synthase A/B